MYKGPLPDQDEVITCMMPRLEVTRGLYMEKIQKRHAIKLRKNKNRQHDAKSSMFRQPSTIEMENLRDGMKHVAEDINLKLQKEKELYKMDKKKSSFPIKQQLAEADIQDKKIAIHKMNNSSEKKKAKFNRKNRNSDVDIFNEKEIDQDFGASKVPRKQSRSFGGEGCENQDDYLINDKSTGSGSAFKKDERMKIRRSGSDD